MDYEELCEKFKPFLIKTSNYYGNVLGTKYPYIDADDFYSIGLEAIQKKMNTYSKEKSNGQTFENYMLSQIKYAMGYYAHSIKKKCNKEGKIRVYPPLDLELGEEFGVMESNQNKDMDFYMENSELTIDNILKPLDSRSKYIVKQVVLHDKTLTNLSMELDISITRVGKLYESAIDKTREYLDKINYLNGGR